MKTGSLFPLLAALVTGIAITSHASDDDSGSILVVSEPNSGGTATLSLSGGSLTVNGSFSGNITGGSSVTETGQGVLRLVGANSYDGATIVNAASVYGGTFNLSSNQPFNPASGGTLTLPGSSLWSAVNVQPGLTLAGWPRSALIEVPELQSVGSTVSILPFVGPLEARTAALLAQYPGSLIKTGSGTLTITSGVVHSVNGFGVLSPGVIMGGNQLLLQQTPATQTFLPPIATVLGSGIISGNSAASGGTLTVADRYAVAGSRTLQIANGGVLILGPNTSSGTLQLTSSTVFLMASRESQISVFGVSSGESLPSAVPEPSTAALLLLGLGAGFCQRRRARA